MSDYVELPVIVLILRSGVSRSAGGSVAISIYTTILTNIQRNKLVQLVPPAATAAGLPESSVLSLLAALPLGSAALAEVPGISNEIIAAASAASKQNYVVGLRTTCLSFLSFGVLGIIGELIGEYQPSITVRLRADQSTTAAICCQDISKKMNNRIELYLENDANVDKNKYH